MIWRWPFKFWDPPAGGKSSVRIVLTDGPYGRSVRTVRTDRPYGRSVRTVRTDRPYGPSVRTFRTDRPYGPSVRTVRTDRPYGHCNLLLKNLIPVRYQLLEIANCLNVLVFFKGFLFLLIQNPIYFEIANFPKYSGFLFCSVQH